MAKTCCFYSLNTFYSFRHTAFIKLIPNLQPKYNLISIITPKREQDRFPLFKINISCHFNLVNLVWRCTDYTFFLTHPNPTSDEQQLWEQEVLECGFFCYQVVAGLGSVHSLMVLKLVPRTEQSAAQAVGLQKDTGNPQIIYKPRIYFFYPAMNMVLLSLVFIVLTLLPGRF